MPGIFFVDAKKEARRTVACIRFVRQLCETLLLDKSPRKRQYSLEGTPRMRNTLALIATLWLAPLDLQLAADEPVNATQAGATDRVVRVYTREDSHFANPERGWFIFPELKPRTGNINSWATDDLLQNYHAQEYRLAKHITLIPTRSDPIPQNYLEALQREADLFRRYGFKVIYRFNYNWDHSISKDDAQVEVTLAHLDQLRPFFTANKDVLLAMEMGFIGFWGEMHSSTQGHILPGTVGFTESGKRIIHKALEVIPEDRFVALRYPQSIFRDPKEYGSIGHTKPLDERTAYSGSEQSRLAAWYANFGAGEMLSQRDPEYLAKWAPETRFVPMWAHCDHFQTVSMDPHDWLETARTFHYVALSNPKDEPHARDIYDRWVEDAAYETFATRLGYRFRLIQAEFPRALRPGAAFEVEIEMTNDGYSRIMNPRAVEVILRGQTTYSVHLDDGRGNRLWLPGPGETKKLTIKSGLPDNMLPGEYEVLLNLHDPQPSLAARPDYSIRLANDDVWEAESGYNRLSHKIHIDQNAEGQPHHAALRFTQRLENPGR